MKREEGCHTLLGVVGVEEAPEGSAHTGRPENLKKDITLGVNVLGVVYFCSISLGSLRLKRQK